MYKRLLPIALTAVMLLVSVTDVHATTISDVTIQKKQTENNLSNVNDEIDKITEKQEQLQEEIQQMDDQLVDVLTSISICQDEIVAKEDEVAKAKEALNDAKEKEQEQYEAMRQRIRFMYEKGDEAYLQLLIESKSFAEALNKADYVEKMYTYDRDLLEDYTDQKEETKEKKQYLEEEEAELLAAHYELALEQQNLEQMIAKKKETVSNFDIQLANAKAQAEQYKKQLTKQTQQLRKLEEEQKKREEEQRKAAEAKRREEEAKKKAAAAAATPAAGTGQAADTTGTDGAGQTADTSGTGGAGQADTSDTGESGQSEQDSSTGVQSSSGGSELGRQIADYAAQFIGNPYKFGGSSLTNGTDCSGFTMSVYAHFGISIPRDSTGQRSAGRGVSYEEAQPGDLICYAGHVALYIGNGRIIHASTEATGIKYGEATYRTILAVRRII